jgi:hypothetical protein
VKELIDFLGMIFYKHVPQWVGLKLWEYTGKLPSVTKDVETGEILGYGWMDVEYTDWE